MSEKSTHTPHEPIKEGPHNAAESKPASGSTWLRRSETNKTIGGVAGGLGEYFAIDPTLVRVAFVLLFLFDGIGLLLYVVLWLIMPAGDATARLEGRDQLRANADDLGNTVRQQFDRLQTDQSKNWWGWLLLAIGAFFLLRNLSFIGMIDWGMYWPIALVAVGVLLLLRR